LRSNVSKYADVAMTPDTAATQTSTPTGRSAATERNTVPRALDSSALVARLGDVSQWELEVLENQHLTPSMRRIRCTAPGLADLSYLPGQDVMLNVPTPSGPTFRRRYTIRSFEPAVPAIDIDVVLHGDGPAASWATDVKPGDTIEAIGPRGKITVDPDAHWHLFAGDDSAVPASLAMAASLPEPADALVVLEVDGPDDEQAAIAPDGQVVPVRWLHRAGGDPASGDQLVAALADLPLPSGSGHAYLAGELGVVAEMRKALLARGMAPEQVSAKAYWRVGRANAAHGEPERP
jgi:NADPH-dependent ferric siderophore reductase